MSGIVFIATLEYFAFWYVFFFGKKLNKLQLFMIFSIMWNGCSFNYDAIYNYGKHLTLQIKNIKEFFII